MDIYEPKLFNNFPFLDTSCGLQMLWFMGYLKMALPAKPVKIGIFKLVVLISSGMDYMTMVVSMVAYFSAQESALVTM